MTKAHQRARRANTEKDVPAGSATRLLTAQADKVLKEKNMDRYKQRSVGRALKRRAAKKRWKETKKECDLQQKRELSEWPEYRAMNDIVIL